VTPVQQVLVGVLLDEGAQGIARSIATLLGLVVLALFVAVSVPIALIVAPHATPPHAPPHHATPPRAAPQQSGVDRPPPPTVIGPQPASTSSRAVDVASHFLGVQYVFGGTDPATGLDCSGLVQLVFRRLGVTLPRTAQMQYDATAPVSQHELQPGDLVFFARTYADPHDWITHVGIYVGGGLQINAPTEGRVVSIQPVFSGFWGAHFAGGGRVSLP
jgi:cell wall-associated NlpC family hydrolase